MKSEKNPLSVIFGAYLKRERNRKRTSSLTMSENLDIGESAYRMIEAGSANMNISRSTLIIGFFDDSKIRFGRLVKFIATIHVYEYLLTLTKKPGISIGEQDPDLEQFFSKTAEFFKTDFSKPKYKTLLDKAVIELSSFLGDVDYRAKSNAEFDHSVNEKIGRVPSVFLTSHLQYLESLKNHSPLHVGPVASEWEDTTTGLISLSGLYKDPELILSDSNLDLFKYMYLFNEKFTSLRMIFVIEEPMYNAPETLKNQFVRALNKRHKKEVITEVEKVKIQIKVILKARINEIVGIDSLLQGRDDIFKSLNAYWNFSHEQGTEIGFVGGADIEKNYAINLSYGESVNRLITFNIIWDSLK